ncbi:MAG TPA: carbohydrate kinase family protein [Gammaproteobacteria bacterium]|nr:carbohydrate kinase family protein [Gammaproteobacteria bacterium]
MGTARNTELPYPGTARALICGSIAYDTIMVYPGEFKDHILPDKIHMLNVSFLVPELRREFGGCAGNIAHNLKLLGGDGVPMGTVGHDFGPYADWMELRGIDDRHIRRLDKAFTAQAYITTDLKDNQITAFHPGAMNLSHLNRVPSDGGFTIGIVSPDGRRGMLEHAAQFADLGIPYMFDPGQGLPMFDGEELTGFVGRASWVTVNDYEAELLQQRTGLTPGEIARRVKALVITRGGDGSIVFIDGDRLEIPAASPARIEDPTGCGDAYRAGLLYGLMHEMDWETTGRLASLMGAIKIESPGTQNHTFTVESFRARFKENFAYDF